MKILIKTTGFIGDILFASSVAEVLCRELSLGYSGVDFLIGFPQPYELLKLNPFIGEVYLTDTFGPYPTSNIEKNYSIIYTMPHVNQNEIPIIQFQKACNVKSPINNFKIYTNKNIDAIVKSQLLNLKHESGKRIIGYVANWKQSTIKYTKEEFESGVVFNNALAHSHSNTRDVNFILSELSKHFILIPLGFEQSVSQYDLGLESCSLYSYTASLIKNCDVVIGQEGGLTNLASGIGTRCIITTDFMNYLYGKFGRMKQFNEIKLGPSNICPDGKHIHADPYISDEELLDLIIKNV